MNDYSFEPAGAVDPNAEAALELVAPTAIPESYYNEDSEESPSDTAIMVGCGVVGCIVG